jgi:glucose-1-phosphate thymidylyltransferase
VKGIILAGGSGTRLYPATSSICKQLLPVYDKPMIYYPLSILMLAGIRDILIISTPKDTPRFSELFKDGKHLGLNISYATQETPRGLADAFLIGETFIGNDNVCLVLGDNIFYGQGLSYLLRKAKAITEEEHNAVVFGYYVKNPQDYGVFEFDNNFNVVSIEEKPQKPKSNYAVVGLYFYDNHVVDIAKQVKPSWRGELEITSINQIYLSMSKLKAVTLGRGFAWLDTGTFDNLLEASQFIQTIEKRQGLKVGCIEEIAYKMGYISKEKLLELAQPLKKSGYGNYLINIVEGESRHEQDTD